MKMLPATVQCVKLRPPVADPMAAVKKSLVPIVTASGATSRPGNLGWGAVRAPGMWNVDFSLTKNIRISERFGAMVRAETFNAFNHFNPLGSSIQTSLNSSQFGQIRGGISPRVIQLNGRLTW